MAFRVGFWGRRRKFLGNRLIGIGFDSSPGNRNSFFFSWFFFNNTDILKIMMTWTGNFFFNNNDVFNNTYVLIFF